jgi:hypothetical protein
MFAVTYLVEYKSPNGNRVSEFRLGRLQPVGNAMSSTEISDHLPLNRELFLSGPLPQTKDKRIKACFIGAKLNTRFEHTSL